LALLEVAHLNVGYASVRGSVRAVRDVSFSLDRDEVLGVVGESGSGKSTLAHALMGYRMRGTSMLEGDVTFDGIPLLRSPATELRKIWGGRIAMVHQNPLASLTPTMRVGEQIAETIRQHRNATAAEARSAVAACLRAVELPEGSDIARRYPHQLSGGQRQRITIAIALALEPDLMILDEPTTNLDATTEAVILDLLEDIRSRTRMAMVYISHNLGVIARVATRVAVMYAGEIVETGSVSQIYTAPVHSYTRALLESLPRPGNSKPKAAVLSGEPVLAAMSIRKSFGRRRATVRAVRGVSLHVPRGAVVGLVGESGSGKSTLLRCIAGLERPESGTIQYSGSDLPPNLADRGKDMLRTMQMVFQDPESTLNPSLSIGTSLRRHLIALKATDGVTARRSVDEALRRVRLDTAFRGRLPRELSGGEKQRVAIARAFLSAPDLVLCDEPLSSLDVSVQAAVCRLLLDLQRDYGTSYVFVSHDLAIVRYMSDRIVVMYLGEVVEEGDAESFDRRPLHPYTEALFSATPIPDPEAATARVRLKSQISDADRERPGCIFNARCHRRKGAECSEIAPPWRDTGGRRYRCHWSPAELAAQQGNEAASAARG